MAILTVVEYANIMVSPGGRIGQAPENPPIKTQAVSIGAKSAQSVKFDAQTKYIRVQTDAKCAIEIGVNPTAIVPLPPNASAGMSPGQTEYHGIPPGSGMSIAVIAVM